MAAWLAVSVVVGVLIGQMIRRREAQVPREPSADPVPRIPARRSAHDDPRWSARPAGRGRPRRR